jgi:hypothetical protein
MSLTFLVCILGFCIAQFTALLVYGICIPPFIKAHGGQSAVGPANIDLGFRWLADYRTAHKLRCRIRHTPWFLRLFEILQALALVFLIAGILSAEFAK